MDSQTCDCLPGSAPTLISEACRPVLSGGGCVERSEPHRRQVKRCCFRGVAGVERSEPPGRRQLALNRLSSVRNWRPKFSWGLTIVEPFIGIKIRLIVGRVGLMIVSPDMRFCREFTQMGPRAREETMFRRSKKPRKGRSYVSPGRSNLSKANVAQPWVNENRGTSVEEVASHPSAPYPDRNGAVADFGLGARRSV